MGDLLFRVDQDKLYRCSLILVCGNVKGRSAWRHLKLDNHLEWEGSKLYLPGQQRKVIAAALLECELMILQLVQPELEVP